MDPQPPASIIEYIGLTMLVAILGAGVLAVIAPEAWLEATVRALLGSVGAM